MYLIKFCPIAPFIDYNLTTSSAKEIETNSNPDINCSTNKIVEAAKIVMICLLVFAEV